MEVATPVSSSFCVPYETKLVVEHGSWCNRSRYTIKDGEGVLLFNMDSEGGLFSQSKRRIYDATSGEALLLMKKDRKCFANSTWKAFRADSESESELLFTARTNIRGSSYKVFLIGNSDSSSPDFRVKKKSWASSSFTILSNGNPVAEGKHDRWGSSSYAVTVYPEVDRAFIAALTIIWMIDWEAKYHAAATAAASS